MKGFLYDTIALVIVLAVLVIGLTLYVMTVNKVGQYADENVKNKVENGLIKFDNYLPYLFSVLVVAVVTVFAVLPISRVFVFLFAALLLTVGIFMESFEPVLSNLLATYDLTMFNNLMYLVGQSKLILLIAGIGMLTIGFLRPEAQRF